MGEQENWFSIDDDDDDDDDDDGDGGDDDNQEEGGEGWFLFFNFFIWIRLRLKNSTFLSNVHAQGRTAQKTGF